MVQRQVGALIGTQWHCRAHKVAAICAPDGTLPFSCASCNRDLRPRREPHRLRAADLQLLHRRTRRASERMFVRTRLGRRLLQKYSLHLPGAQRFSVAPRGVHYQRGTGREITLVRKTRGSSRNLSCSGVERLHRQPSSFLGG